MAKHPKGWGTPKQRKVAPTRKPFEILERRLEHKEGTWAPATDGGIIREEWQVHRGFNVDTFYTLEEAKAFVTISVVEWAGAGRYQFEILHVTRYLHRRESA